MKIVIAVFMTVLMLFASVDLCKDEDNCGDNEKTEVGKAGNSNQNPESPCTPFCNCTRCPFSVIVPAYITGVLVECAPINKFDTVLPGTSIQVSNSVWQPPKLS